MLLQVNTIDDDEPKGDQYTPDGGYIPRILFLDTEGTVMTQHVNKGGNDKYKVQILIRQTNSDK